jgi:hypothetical protein
VQSDMVLDLDRELEWKMIYGIDLRASMNAQEIVRSSGGAVRESAVPHRFRAVFKKCRGRRGLGRDLLESRLARVRADHRQKETRPLRSLFHASPQRFGLGVSLSLLVRHMATVMDQTSVFIGVSVKRLLAIQLGSRCWQFLPA